MRNTVIFIILAVVTVALLVGYQLFQKRLQAPTETSQEQTGASGESGGGGTSLRDLTEGGSSTGVQPQQGEDTTKGGLPIYPVQPGAATPTQTQNQQQAVQSGNVVLYTAQGFSPKTLTVKKGTMVLFKNDSSNKFWVASDDHPSHTKLPGFDMNGALGKGSTYEYRFDKTGSWGFHNHMNPAHTGTIVVTE